MIDPLTQGFGDFYNCQFTNSDTHINVLENALNMNILEHETFPPFMYYIILFNTGRNDQLQKCQLAKDINQSILVVLFICWLLGG
jgi:hypothetical protein